MDLNSITDHNYEASQTRLSYSPGCLPVHTDSRRWRFDMDTTAHTGLHFLRLVSLSIICVVYDVSKASNPASVCPQQPAFLSLAACTLPWPGQLPTPHPPLIPLIMTLLPPFSRLRHLPLLTIPLSGHKSPLAPTAPESDYRIPAPDANSVYPSLKDPVASEVDGWSPHSRSLCPVTSYSISPFLVFPPAIPHPFPFTPRGDSSVVRAPDSWLKGRGFESLQDRRDFFLSFFLSFFLQGRLSVLTLISISVPPPCYCSST